MSPCWAAPWEGCPVTGDGSLPHPAICQGTAKQGCLQEVFKPKVASPCAENWVLPRTVFPAWRNCLHPSGRCRLQPVFLQADLRLPQEPASRPTGFVIHPSPLALPSRVWAGDESPAVLALGAPLFPSYLKCKSLLQALPSYACFWQGCACQCGIPAASRAQVDSP